MADERHIVAIGGGGLGGLAGDALDEYVLALCRADHPRMLVVPTGWRDDESSVREVYDLVGRRAEVSHLALVERAPPDLRALVLGQDLVWVTGGDTALLLAVWRARGFDRILREAWEAGVVLAGSSAGAVCWFEDGVTRLSETELVPLGDGLGLLAGSFFAHHDVADRRAAALRLVGSSLPAGVAAEERVGLHYVGSELGEAVTARAGGVAYRLERRNGTVIEEALPTRFLDDPEERVRRPRRARLA